MRRLEDRGLETDVRWQKTDVRGQKTDVGGQVNEFGRGEKRRSEDKKVGAGYADTALITLSYGLIIYSNIEILVLRARSQLEGCADILDLE